MTNTEEPTYDKDYATVGELILTASGVDHVLSLVVIECLSLGDAALILPVVLTLEPARKIEILKARAKHIRPKEWKSRLLGFVTKAETVFKHRNIVAHSTPMLDSGRWVLKPNAAAKLLQRLDLAARELPSFSLAEARQAIEVAEQALGAGVELVENFRRVNAELAARKASKRGV